MTRILLALGLALSLLACGDDQPAASRPDAGPAALERPLALPRPPTGRLPPELRPPR